MGGDIFRIHRDRPWDPPSLLNVEYLLPITGARIAAGFVIFRLRIGKFKYVSNSFVIFRLRIGKFKYLSKSFVIFRLRIGKFKYLSISFMLISLDFAYHIRLELPRQITNYKTVIVVNQFFVLGNRNNRPYFNNSSSLQKFRASLIQFMFSQHLRTFHFLLMFL